MNTVDIDDFNAAVRRMMKKGREEGYNCPGCGRRVRPMPDTAGQCAACASMRPLSSAGEPFPRELPHPPLMTIMPTGLERVAIALERIADSLERVEKELMCPNAVTMGGFITTKYLAGWLDALSVSLKNQQKCPK